MSGISSLVSGIADSIKEIPIAIGEKISGVVDAVLSIPTAILDGIKGFFIPDEGYFDEKLHEINVSLSRLGVGAYSMDSIFAGTNDITDVDVAIMGATGTILRSDIVMTGISAFRPAIRGLMALFLVFYNFNQFCSLIGLPGVSISGLGGLIGIGTNSIGIEDKGGK